MVNIFSKRLNPEKNKMKSKDRVRLQEILLLAWMRFKQSRRDNINTMRYADSRVKKLPINRSGNSRKDEEMKPESKSDCEGYLLFYRRLGSEV